MIMIFGPGMELDILDEFDGQGHRSKVKVTKSKNVISSFSDLSAQIPNPGLWCDTKTSCDVMTSNEITT